MTENKGKNIPIIYINIMPRYQNYCKEEEETNAEIARRTNQQFAAIAPDIKGLTGTTWDAKHMSNFLNKSNYSNWKGDSGDSLRSQSSGTRYSKKSFSASGDYFFRKTNDNRNASKIGYTNVFPLITNIPPNKQRKTLYLDKFMQTTSNDKEVKNQQKVLKLQCSPDDKFLYEGNSIKFYSTDPITMKFEPISTEHVSGYSKERMTKLIEKRHPHGMTGIDHPQNPEPKFYAPYQENIRIREQPNTHASFLLSREWKTKGRQIANSEQKSMKAKLTLMRKFRNDNVHGFNILTNRIVQ